MFKSNYAKKLSKTMFIFDKMLSKLRLLIVKMDTEISEKEEIIQKNNNEIVEINQTKKETIAIISNFEKLLNKN